MSSNSAEERLVVGLQPVREAVRVHRSRVQRLWITRRASDRRGRLEALARFARDQGVGEVEQVAESQLDRLASGSAHQGVAAWAPPLTFVDPAEVVDDSRLLAVALDGIQDPQNFGAVIRSAVGVAGATVIWGAHGSAPLTPATFRASAGAVEHARLCRARSLHGLLQQASASGIRVLGLDARAEATLSDIDMTQATVIVIGSEQAGMQRAVRRACTDLARITLAGDIDSLNASAAAAVALYEAARQRMISAS